MLPRLNRAALVSWALCFVVIVVLLYWFKQNTLKEDVSVPNIVHYILFGKSSLDFVTFLSILSVIKVHHPDSIKIHTDSKTIAGHYWTVLMSYPKKNTTLEIVQLSQPTHVFGQPLSSVYHASDVARIQILMKYGGIYLDNDMLVLRPLDKFLKYEMAVGWPFGEYIGTQILIAQKEARFLKLWLESYRKYHPREWYYNAGQLPTQQILEKQPELALRVPFAFGVTNLAAELYGHSPWPKWRLLHSIHLLSRHPPAPQNINEKFIRHYRAPFGEIARWLLYQIKPRIAVDPFNTTETKIS